MRSRVAYACAPLPPIVMGLMVMGSHHVPVTRLLFQLGATLLGLGAFVFMQRIRWSATGRIWFIFLTIAALAAPLLFPGIHDVHRWISFGGFQLHVGAVLCPLLLVAFARRSALPRFDIVGQLAAIGMLAAHPDAGQATALGTGLVVLTWWRDEPTIALLRTLSYLVMVTVAWSRPDPLGPIAEVEQIVEVAFIQSRMLGVIALASLAIPLAVMFAAIKKASQLAPILGAYCLTTCIVTRLGHFPVPLLGYGTGPILGFYLAFGAIASESSQLTTLS